MNLCKYQKGKKLFMGLFDKLLGKKKQTSQDDFMSILMGGMGLTGNEEINTDGPSNPNYGLCAENPVFVKGPVGTDTYLAQLSTPSGQKLSWNRLGSTESEGVPGCTDIYVGSLEDGSEYITIFLNWYGPSNSTTAPKGLKM